MRGGEEMDKNSVIQAFVDNRPEALGAYGYGSGVFKQVGYDSSDKPQIDLIFLVDDLRAWHLENMETNRDDYTFSGRVFINFSNVKKLKGNNRITYYSHIQENGYRFKYGVMEEEDFLSFLESWDNFFIAGRFHKPVMQIKSNEREIEAINKNKEQALLVAAILAPSVISKKNFFKIICNLSYAGSPRMKVAENPNKVNNIVDGCYEKLARIYSLNNDYISEFKDGYVHISHSKALSHVFELPLGLLSYLIDNGYDVTNVFHVRKGIVKYLEEHNKQEELAQSIDGIKTNGIVRSTPYLLAKVKKRIKSM